MGRILAEVKQTTVFKPQIVMVYSVFFVITYKFWPPKKKKNNSIVTSWDNKQIQDSKKCARKLVTNETLQSPSLAQRI